MAWRGAATASSPWPSNIATALSTGVDFVRVDLYETATGIKFGELTNYPTGGLARPQPRSFDRWLGADWHPRYTGDAGRQAGQAREAGVAVTSPVPGPHRSASATGCEGER